MSSGKRRKLETTVSSQGSAISAISAIAARRQLAMSALHSQGSSDEAAGSSTNSFSALQSSRPSKSRSETSKTRLKPASEAHSRRNDGSENVNSASPKSSGQAKTVRLPVEILSMQRNKRPQVITYSSFQLSEQNSLNTAEGTMKLKLAGGERFMLLGSFGLRIKSGEVRLAGATLQASHRVFWVHAPHCLALPVIRVTQTASIEVLNDPQSSGLRGLGGLSPLLRCIWNEPCGLDTAARRTFQFIGTSLDAPKRCAIQELVSLPEWNKMLDSIQVNAHAGPVLTALVCGPKSAGKSTFGRLLINRLLTASPGKSDSAKPLAVLDLDPGQPEYAPPGTVSLIRVSEPNLGAPFTHTTFDNPGCAILRCHSLASVTPASSPDFFIACALDLYGAYQSMLRDCPLIINTPGWVFGTGLDILVELITHIRPQEVIYMSEDGPADVVETLKAATRANFTTIPSQPSEHMSRTAAQFRTMHMMSYFHSSLSAPSETAASPIQWSIQPLTSWRPYTVTYGSDGCGILGIVSYDYQPSLDLVADAINGSILAIVEIEKNDAFGGLGHSLISSGTPEVLETKEGLPFIINSNDATLDPNYSRTVGLALIRGIDIENKTLQVVTPTALSKLLDIQSRGNSIVLVLGSFDNPAWAYTQALYWKAARDSQNDESDVLSDADWADLDVGLSDEHVSGDEVKAEDLVSAEAPSRISSVAGSSTVPWIEILEGNQKRPLGSRAWRVRRDLGRGSLQ